MSQVTWLIFVLAAILEVGGDALIRKGLRGSVWAMIAAGCATLALYGVIVNLVKVYRGPVYRGQTGIHHFANQSGECRSDPGRAWYGYVVMPTLGIGRCRINYKRLTSA